MNSTFKGRNKKSRDLAVLPRRDEAGDDLQKFDELSFEKIRVRFFAYFRKSEKKHKKSKLSRNGQKLIVWRI